MRFQTKNGVLIAQANGETLRIEPWGKDSLRVRATMLPGFSGKDWALTEVPEKTEAKAEQFEVDHLEIDGSMGKEPAHRSPMEKSVLWSTLQELSPSTKKIRKF